MRLCLWAQALLSRGASILLLALGLAERDGVLVAAGYALLLLATVYVGGLLSGMVWAALHFLHWA